VANRLKVYFDQTSPLIAYYEQRGLLCTINGEQPSRAFTVTSRRRWVPNDNGKQSGRSRQNARGRRIVAETLEELGKQIAPGLQTLDLDACAVAVEGAGRSAVSLPASQEGRIFRRTSVSRLTRSWCTASPAAGVEEGDIVSVDVGAVLDGWVADAAWTFRSARCRKRRRRCWM
jgi:methionine aminopeptidase